MEQQDVEVSEYESEKMARVTKVINNSNKIFQVIEQNQKRRADNLKQLNSVFSLLSEMKMSNATFELLHAICQGTSPLLTYRHRGRQHDQRPADLPEDRLV